MKHKPEIWKITHNGSSYYDWYPIDADYANEINFEDGGWSCEHAGTVDVSGVRAELMRRYALDGFSIEHQAMLAPRCLQDLFWALLIRPNPTADVIKSHATLDDLLRHDLVKIEEANA